MTPNFWTVVYLWLNFSACRRVRNWLWAFGLVHNPWAPLGYFCHGKEASQPKRFRFSTIENALRQFLIIGKTNWVSQHLVTVYLVTVAVNRCMCVSWSLPRFVRLWPRPGKYENEVCVLVPQTICLDHSWSQILNFMQTHTSCCIKWICTTFVLCFTPHPPSLFL